MDDCDHASPPLVTVQYGTTGRAMECDGTWAVKRGRIVCIECNLVYGSIEMAEVASFGPAGSKGALALAGEVVAQPFEAEESW